MNGVAIGLGLLVAGAVVVFLAGPWRARREALQQSGSEARFGGETLAERREAALTALRHLDFDHAVGKVAEEDYEPLRQALLAEAASIMAQADEEQAAAEAELDARIEAEVLTIRQTLDVERDRAALASDNICPACGRIARPGDLYCAGCGAQLSAVCPECGRAVRPTELFCAGCGAKLALAVS